MKIKFIFGAILLIAAAIFVSNCKKDKPILLSNSITMGQTDEMSITPIDTAIEGSYNHPAKYFIDIDADGIDDYSLESNIFGSPGLGTHNITQIHCLNADSKLLVNHLQDTLFLNTIKDFSDTTSPYSFFNYYTQSCTRTSPSDSVLNCLNYDELIHLNESEMVSINSNFDFKEYVSIKTVNTGSGPFYTLIYSSNDTLIYDVKQTLSYGGSTNPNNPFYVAILKYVSGTPLLGWIKLDQPYTLTIGIKEIAIQQNN